jgi:hypothetical protein
MARFTNANAFLALGFETTHGTAVALTQFPYIISADLGETANHVDAGHVGRVGGAMYATPQTGRVAIAPKFVSPLQYNLVGWLFRAFDGTVSTTGAGPYTHVWSPGTSQSFTMEYAPSDALTESVDITGCKLVEATIKFPFDGIATIETSWLGLRKTAPATKTTAVLPTANEVNGGDLTTLTLGSFNLLVIAQGVDVKLTNPQIAGGGMRRDANGRLTAEELTDGSPRMAEISVPIELTVAEWHDFHDAYVAVPNPTENDFTLVATDPSTGETLTIVVRNCSIVATAFPTVSDPSALVRVTLSLKGRADPPGGDPLWTATLVNGDASPHQT